MWKNAWSAVRYSKYIIKNEQIIFDSLRVIDNRGKDLGLMKKTDAIHSAKSAGYDLYLINFHVEPPVCKFSKTDITPVDPAKQEPSVDDSYGFSFDPVMRPMTVQMSSTIAKEELERKIDILRKHLLRKTRCEVVIQHVQSRTDFEEINSLIQFIVDEVADIAKPASELLFDENNLIENDIRFKLWHCNPEQTVQTTTKAIGVNTQSLPSVKEIHNPEVPRSIRRKVDPKIQNTFKHPTKLEDE